MKLPNGQCSTELNRVKHISWFNENISQPLIESTEEPKQETTLTLKEFEDNEVLEFEINEGIAIGSATYDDVLYDKCLISYEELNKSKDDTTK